MQYLGIDIGSSATKAVVIDQNGEKLFSFHELLKTNFLDDNRVEQDPLELWRSCARAIDRALAKIHSLSGFGICCQRSAVCAWHNNNILHPLITWRDSRWISLIEKLRSNFATVHSKSGLPITVHYAATKIAALQKQFPGAIVGTFDTFLCYKLTGKFLSDETSAAGSMLYNLDTRDWDYYLCAIFDCDYKRLPPIKPSLSSFGKYNGLPLLSLSGDQQAVSFALSAHGDVSILSLGTVAAFIVPTGSTIRREIGFITRISWSSEREIRYFLEGTVNCCGAIIDLIMKELKLASAYKDLEQLLRRTKAMEDVHSFLPFGGTPSPEWRWDLPFAIKNWRKASADQLCLAMIEGLGSFIVELIERMRPFCLDSMPITVTGGMAANRYLLEYVAACLRVDLLLVESADSGAMGASMMAMRSKGIDILPKHSHIRITCRDKEMRLRYERWCKFSKELRDQNFPKEWVFCAADYLACKDKQ